MYAIYQTSLIRCFNLYLFIGFFYGSKLLRVCMDVNGNIIRKDLLFLTRLTTKIYTHDFTCNMYWYQLNLQTKKVFVHTIQGHSFIRFFVILQSGITTKLNCMHHHWRVQRQCLGTNLTTYHANPQLI